MGKNIDMEKRSCEQCGGGVITKRTGDCSFFVISMIGV